MLTAEFGIIEDIGETQEYSYTPEKYQCICIDDAYIDDWWDKLVLLKTYFHSLDRPEFGLARWGITLIPPESLSGFQEIVLSDRRINKDIHGTNNHWSLIDLNINGLNSPIKRYRLID